MFGRLAVALVLAVIWEVGALRASEPPTKASGTTPIGFGQPTHETIANSPYYLKWPKQSELPDGFFPSGTKLQRLQRVPNYCRVRSVSGVEAYVAMAGLRVVAKSHARSIFTFPAEEIRKLQARARQAAAQRVPVTWRRGDAKRSGRPTRDGPNSTWIKTPLDPMALLGEFEPLHIKSGYILRGYFSTDGANADGVVWAFPEEAEFPAPSGLADQDILGRPKPPSVPHHLMLAIDGDHSAWSYLCASILRRELDELGAHWHGVHWKNQTVLGSNPLTKGLLPGSGSSREKEHLKPDRWTWLEPEPKEWNPLVQVEGDRVTVTFHTYPHRGQQGIYRHVDMYKLGSYEFERKLDVIAQGPVFVIY